ncbi:MAG: hypothetical protein LQ343_008018 [Gyalolechia ehrenbergii]|nr:MAG: hypothetical protein LQ343_008018 [Gyalolechia ehrenbergii]
MSEANPPSPPPTGTAERSFEDGFYKLVQHNAATQYQPNSYPADSSPYLHSAPTTSYSSPEPRHMALDQYNQRYYQNGLPSYYNDHRYAIQASTNGEMMYPDPSNGYPGLTSVPPNYTTNPYQFGSSPTPDTSDPGSRAKRTRVMRSMPVNGSTSPSHGSQASNSPRPKRSVKKSKTEAVNEASISAPLSQLCLDVPVVDVFVKVNRSVEERQEEARKDNKIKRPSNSFMLYRSAYGERVKALYPQNNHQIISRICGASWKMETPDIKEKFSAYYELEKENHAKAHPTYKFSPAKSSPSRKRRGTGDSSDEEDGVSQVGDFDPEYRPRGARRSRLVKTPRTSTPTSYPANPPALLNSSYGLLYNQGLGFNASAWQVCNPGKPMPIPMNGSMDSQYYQTSVYQRAPNVEDVFVRRTEAQPSSSQALIGLPGGSHEELLGADSAENSPSPQVDPLLLNYDGGPGFPGGIAHDQDFRDFDHQGLYEGELAADGQASETPYKMAFDSWEMNGPSGQSERFAEGGEYDWLV